MERNLSFSESIFMQAIATTSLLTTLNNEDFFSSDYYKKMDLGSNESNIRKILDASTLGNPATMQMFLYVLLVMPKELLGATKNAELQNISTVINKKVKTLVSCVHTTYAQEDESNLDTINFTRHIRNSIAHSKCEYTVEDSVCYITFKDELPNKKEICNIKMTTGNAGNLMNELQRLLMGFLNNSLKL